MGAKNKGGSKKRGPKATLAKLGNKRLNKLAKQGKLKKRKDRPKLLKQALERINPQHQQEQHQQEQQQEQEQHQQQQQQQQRQHPAHQNVHPDSCHNAQEDIPLEEADHEYFATKGRNFSFLENVSDPTEERKRKRKHQHEDQDENLLESQYEQAKKRPAGVHLKDTKALLPIKSKAGIIARHEQLDPEPEEKDVITEDGSSSQNVGGAKEVIVEPLRATSTARLYLERQRKLEEKKQQMALLSSAIIEAPEENTKKLKELRQMLDEDDPDVCITVKKYAMASLLEVFKDIIPGYRIREVTDKEKQQSAKKETMHLRGYEDSLITNYKAYLEFLESMATGKVPTSKRKKKPKINGSNLPKETSESLSLLALKCLCDLLARHPHFNFRTNIIAVVIPFTNHKNQQISDTVCGCVKQIFREDKAGAVTLEIVRLIGRIVKSRKFKVKTKVAVTGFILQYRAQEMVLNTFLSLKIKEIQVQGEKLEKKITRREKFRQMSRKDRKRQKQMGHLEKELQDAALEDDQSAKLRYHTEVINMVFLTYFRILKQARHSVLLSSVLEGLAKFAHLINVDFFEDLFSVLNELVDTEELTYRESLHCVQTAFTILTGQGAALNIDPLRFYNHLYRTLFQLHAGISGSDVPVVLACLDIVISKRRKQVSVPRILGYMKRLCTLALQLETHGALGFLATTRNFIHAYPRSDILFDTECLGSGTFMPELDSLDHCGAHNTALYELHLLRKHYHPTVRKYSAHVLQGAPSQGAGTLAPQLGRKSPIELYQEFDTEDMTFNPPIEKTPKVHKNVHKYEKDYVQREMQSLVEKVLAGTKSSAIATDVAGEPEHQGQSLRASKQRGTSKKRERTKSQ